MFFELFVLGGFLAVAVNPSPYYAGMGLVFGAGGGCLVLMHCGLTFMSVVLFLVYLGGMMIVFGYCAALVGEPYPEGWGNIDVLIYVGGYVSVLGLWAVMWYYDVENAVGSKKGKGYGEKFSVVPEDWWGVSSMFGAGGWILLIGCWGLLLTLLGVLEIVRGREGGALRAV